MINVKMEWQIVQNGIFMKRVAVLFTKMNMTSLMMIMDVVVMPAVQVVALAVVL